MENQTTAPEVQSEQTETVVQNNTEATPQTVLTETEQPKELNFKDLIPSNQSLAVDIFVQYGSLLASVALLKATASLN